MIDVEKYHKALDAAYLKICVSIATSFCANDTFFGIDIAMKAAMMWQIESICRAFNYPFNLLAETQDTFHFDKPASLVGAFASDRNSLL